MGRLVWDPFDVFSVLGVAPEEGDYEISHRYVVEQSGIRLELTIWQYESEVSILLWSEHLPNPILRYDLLDCPGIRIVNDKRGNFLEFAAANTFTGRYDGYSVIPYGLRLSIEPQISLEPFVVAV